MALEFHTERLYLRQVAPSDLEAFHDLLTDAGVRRYLLDDIVISREVTAGFLKESEVWRRELALGYWLIFENDGHTLVGFCGIKPYGEPEEIEVMYGIYPGYWGRGIAVEACRALLAHAFNTVGLPFVIAETDLPNTNSVRVMEKLGMRDDGVRERASGPNRRFVLSRECFDDATR